MNRKAIIFGIKKYKLTSQEKSLFKKAKPWGIILFSRNIKNIFQLRKLTDDIKFLFKDKNYPILIDQEGGRVSRLNKIIDLSTFSQDFFSKLHMNLNKSFFSNYKVYISSVCDILKSAGININTVPVLDVRRKKSHNIIGDRSFGNNSKIVSYLGKLCIHFHENNKIATVMKHVPGLGLSKKDSHFNTPVIRAGKKELLKKDFKPFKECKSLFAMTGHAIYLNYDSYNTATHSSTVIKKIIRNYMKFKGILMSDDISMKSLKYSLEENAEKALQAGCNIVLHCNGNIKEMSRLIKVIPKIDKFTQKKTSQFYNFLR
tara:strand:- start:659 stop:1606 length:948 start_codon:yes stop_codon:yes gene_type:complete